jgi:DNA-binding CsgD family transcriptional regulator
VNNAGKYINFRRALLLMNISFLLLSLALNSFFFYRKIKTYYFILNRDLHKNMQIDNLNQEVVRLKRLLNKDVFSEETLKDLVDSIQLNDTVFLEKFEVFFPGFFDKVQKISENPLTGSDLKMCAMLKLGFTAKQIAIYTNSSIKSVEGKIYRLRKKLNINTDEDSKAWFIIL